MIVRELITKLGFVADEKALDRYEASAKRVAGQMQKIGGQMSLFLTAPLTALGGLALKAASDANEIASKFSQVFKEVESRADAVALNIAKNYGLSNSASKDLLATTGDLLSGFGFSSDAALDMSEQVQKLAVDLASFKNVKPEDASAALTKALLGERESIKSLGIAILEEDVKNQMAIESAKGLRFATERQAKAFATMSLLMQRSKNAVGDFARTQDQLANRMRTFRGRLNNVMEDFGAKLIPIALRVLDVGQRLIEWLSGLSEGTKEFIIILAAVAAGFGPVLAVVGAAIPLIMAFGAAVLWVPAVIAALIVIIALLAQDIKVWAEGGDSLLGRYLGSWTAFRDRFTAIWTGIVTTIRTVVAFLITVFSPILEAAKNAFASLLAIIGGVFKIIAGLFTLNFGMIAEGIVQIFGGVFNGIKSIFEGFVAYISGAFNVIGGIIRAIPGAAKFVGTAATVAGTAFTAASTGVSGVDLVSAGKSASAAIAPAAGPVSQNIAVNLPPGTTAEQGEQIAKIAADAARGVLSGTVTDNPATE